MLIFRALNNKTVFKITHPTHASQKYKKKMSFVTTKVKKGFTSGQLTPYSGLSVISDFIKHTGIYDSLNEWFPTVNHNAGLFSTAQVLSSIVLDSLCGVRIAFHILQNECWLKMISRIVFLSVPVLCRCKISPS